MVESLQSLSQQSVYLLGLLEFVFSHTFKVMNLKLGNKVAISFALTEVLGAEPHLQQARREPENEDKLLPTIAFTVLLEAVDITVTIRTLLHFLRLGELVCLRPTGSGRHSAHKLDKFN